MPRSYDDVIPGLVNKSWCLLPGELGTKNGSGLGISIVIITVVVVIFS